MKRWIAGPKKWKNQFLHPLKAEKGTTEECKWQSPGEKHFLGWKIRRVGVGRLHRMNVEPWGGEVRSRPVVETSVCLADDSVGSRGISQIQRWRVFGFGHPGLRIEKAVSAASHFLHDTEAQLGPLPWPGLPQSWVEWDVFRSAWSEKVSLCTGRFLHKGEQRLDLQKREERVLASVVIETSQASRRVSSGKRNTTRTYWEV